MEGGSGGRAGELRSPGPPPINSLYPLGVGRLAHEQLSKKLLALSLIKLDLALMPYFLMVKCLRGFLWTWLSR